MTTKEFAKILQDKLTSEYGVDLSVASHQQIYRALALICRQMMSENHKKFQSKAIGTGSKQVYYLCMEFLMGRSLKMSLFNLGLNDAAQKALAEADISLDSIYEEEPDAGLGNGGLGRLAACYLDSMTTLEIPATGYSICYELGIFKQKIVDGQQVELPDNWLGLGDAWLIPKMDETEEVRFGVISTGASNDIEQATKLARAMVTRYGMSEDFDMVALETVSNQYLGGDASLACSAETQTQIDRRVVELVKTAHQKAIQILMENREKLDELSQYLYQKETITGDECMKILNG